MIGFALIVLLLVFYGWLMWSIGHDFGMIAQERRQIEIDRLNDKCDLTQ